VMGATGAVVASTGAVAVARVRVAGVAVGVTGVVVAMGWVTDAVVVASAGEAVVESAWLISAVLFVVAPAGEGVDWADRSAPVAACGDEVGPTSDPTAEEADLAGAFSDAAEVG
jgi:hypothetical protein